MMKLSGMVLCGGQSVRMGLPKHRIIYTGLPQWKKVYDLLKLFCQSVYISCRRDQVNEFDGYESFLLVDDKSIGPASGLISASNKDCTSLWMILACDMPFLASKNLKKLVLSTKENGLSSFFESSEKLINPLCGIWSAKDLKQFKSLYQKCGFSSPRKYLSKQKVNVLPMEDETFFANINTYDQYLSIIKELILS